jgi:hypothetical protein
MLFLLVFGAAQVRLIPKTIVILCALQGAVYLLQGAGLTFDRARYWN